jgi:adenosylmethionine-8-amino-7-oxononanoate aminotransferase
MTTAISDSESLRRASLRYLWMHNRDWTQMAEEGEPQIIESGAGVRVTDAEGRSWIDVNGGYNSVNAGYGRTEIGQAAYEQMLNLHYFPQGTTTVPMAKLAAKLAEITPGSLSRVFPVSGGSEANETALKIARAYHKRTGEPGRYKVISRIGSYHGMTAGVLWLGGSPYQPRHDYEPIYPGMVHAPQPNPYRSSGGDETPSECAIRCAEAVEQLIEFHGPQTVAAIIAEPVAIPQGAVVPSDEYWPMLREICDKYGVLLIADEVICGFGRTGKMFALEHWGVVPDIMTVAKGIVSSYLPMAAAVVKQEVADAFAGERNLLRHVFTAAGHPVAAAASLKNIEIIEQNDLVSNSARMGSYFLEQLRELKVKHPSVGDVRGIGLLLGIELVSDRERKTPFDESLQVGKRLTEKMRSRGIIMRFNGGKVTLGPPLCITAEDINEIISALNGAISELETELPVG